MEPNLIQPSNKSVSQSLSLFSTVWLPYVMAILASGGMALTGYLTYEKLTLGKVAGCSSGGACEIVLTSVYANVFGIPLTIFGFLLYASVLGTALWPNLGSRRSLGLLGLTTIGAGFSFYLLGLLFLELQALCPYCLTSVGLWLTLFALSVIYVLKGPLEQRKEQSKWAIQIASLLAIATALGAAGLYTIQKNTPRSLTNTAFPELKSIPESQQ
jgi:uncharacterized membrane protein